jgi:hypothetical protein
MRQASADLLYDFCGESLAVEVQTKSAMGRDIEKLAAFPLSQGHHGERFGYPAVQPSYVVALSVDQGKCLPIFDEGINVADNFRGQQIPRYRSVHSFVLISMDEKHQEGEM